ncbi:sperm flagellar protein 1 [Trichonephila clavata]|uniref:Sperm flagellar protein 1 n=1 Tax=Trichonephila clavata TaxID=2740835 RepID=A0A8X6GD23_TRICU|nr:sperm flagellar protein 1 [Trichonephila clavata]
MSGIEQDTLVNLYDWLDTIPFSRQKKNLARDFSDASLAAELIKYFFSGMVDLHNYPSSQKLEQKKINWSTLNHRVLKKLDFPISDATILELASAKREATEYFLNTLRGKIDAHLKKKSVQPKRKDIHQTKSDIKINSIRTDISRNVDIATVNRNINASSPDKTKCGEQPSMQKCKSMDRVDTGDKKKMWSLKDSISDTVPREVYEQKVQELLEKEETIQVLKARIQRLEYMLHFKDITISRQQHLLELKPNVEEKCNSKKIITR